MDLDAVAWRHLQAGETEAVRRIFLGPEIRQFLAAAGTAEELAALQARRAAVAEADFADVREDARKRLIAVALGAALVIVLLLVTANDVARMALEGERRRPRRRCGRRTPVTQDVLLTLSLLLSAAWPLASSPACCGSPRCSSWSPSAPCSGPRRSTWSTCRWSRSGRS